MIQSLEVNVKRKNRVFLIIVAQFEMHFIGYQSPGMAKIRLLVWLLNTCIVNEFEKLCVFSL